MEKLCGWISIAILLLSSIVLAESDSYHILKLVNNSFYGGFALRHLNYQEDNLAIDPTLPKNISHQGLAYGLAINIREIFFERLYADLFGEFDTGQIKYDGFGLYSPHNPIKQKNTNNFIDGDLKLGVVLLNHRCFQIIPYGWIGFHYWGISLSHSYDYYNFKSMIGTKINYVLFDSLVLSPYASIGKILGGHAKSKVYDRGNNFLGGVNFALGSKPIYEFGLEINYRLENEIFITSMVSYTKFSYGKSNWQTVGSERFIEPDSKTNEVKFGIGVRYGLL
ncbi:MAG: hypothetical protein LBL17_03590 [Coxiellaceae bacterium]|jgi:hypothetical protein|nr:hypothetical protein [Coxiellaceae bacterium]